MSKNNPTFERLKTFEKYMKIRKFKQSSNIQTKIFMMDWFQWATFSEKFEITTKSSPGTKNWFERAGQILVSEAVNVDGTKAFVFKLLEEQKSTNQWKSKIYPISLLTKIYVIYVWALG